MVLGIYGTGGSGKELLEMIERFPELNGRWERLVFIDDVRPKGDFRGHPMMPLEEFARSFATDAAEVVIAVGEPYYRQRMAAKAVAAGFGLATVIHPMAHVSPSATIGSGVVIRLGSVVSADAKVGDNVWIQTYATIGHDAVVGENSQISSYAMLAGAVKVGRNVFVGISAAVREELEIGDDAVVSMGAMVMRPVLPRQIVAGNPATVLMMNDSRRVFKSRRHAANAASHRLVVEEDGAGGSDEGTSVSPETVSRLLGQLSAEMPEIDFANGRQLADDGVIDSVTMVRILGVIKREFGVEIPYERISPSSFNSVEAIAGMVERCQEGAADGDDRRFITAFRRNVRRHPDRFCLGDGKTDYTYGEAFAQVGRVAAELKRRGVSAGDRVVLSAVARVDYPIVYLAAQYLGVVTVPVDRFAKPETLAKLAAEVQPKLVLTASELAELMSCADPSSVPDMAVADDEAIAEMLFTTGTTGMPKATMLSQRAIRAIAQNTVAGVGMLESDVVLIPIPLNHSVGMRVLRAALTKGAGVVVQNGFAFARETEHNLDVYGCTAMVCVPAAIDTLRVQMGKDFERVLGRLRYLEFGAGSVPPSEKRRLVEGLPGVRLFNTWGSSETGGAIFLDFSARPDKADTLGRPVAGVQVGTMDEAGVFGRADGAASAGRLALRGAMRMSGYLGRSEETSSALRGEWLVTNDLAYVDADGFVHLLGRADDIINVGGEKVAPVEVENVAMEFSGLRECACVGVADELLGQVPRLFYAAEVEIDEGELVRFLADGLARYQVPRVLTRVDALPRNAMGKIDRRALRDFAGVGG